MKKKLLFFLIVSAFISLSAQNKDIKNAQNNLVSDEILYCSGNTFSLHVDATATSTGDYTVSKELQSSFPLSAGTNAIKFSGNGSNKFSEPINIGFDFSFYGQTYTQVVAGTNGRLVFTNSSELQNLNDVNTYVDRTFSDASGSNGYSVLPSTDYNKIYKNNAAQEIPLAQIFFGYTDLYASNNASTQYNYKSVTFGSLKGLIISYQNEIHTDGVGGISGSSFSSYVLLLEDGRIVVYVNGKIEESYNAILGIQKEDASKFKVARPHSTNGSDYNNGKWKSEGVAWVFTPSQNLNPKIVWKVDGVQQSTNQNFTYAPTADQETLSAEISFFDDTNTQVGDTKISSVVFKKVLTPEINTPVYGNCGEAATLSIKNIQAGVTYNWYKNGVLYASNQTSIQANTGSYVVKAVSSAGTECTQSSAVSVNINSILPPLTFTENQIFAFCDNTSVGKININLLQTIQYSLGADYSVTFSENGSTVTNYTNVELNSGDVRTFKVLVKTNSGINPPCEISRNFIVKYLSLPKQGEEHTQTLCFETTDFRLEDFETANFNTSLYNFQYSLDGVNYSSLTSVNPQVNSLVYVKIKAKDTDFNCESIQTLKFNFNPPVIANQPNIDPFELQQCASSTQTYDLTQYYALINPNPSSVNITYHNSLAEAQSGSNAISNPAAYRSGMGDNVLYIRVEDKTTHCVSQNFPSITLRVYSRPQLRSTQIGLSNCAGNTVFNLTQNIDDLFSSIDPKIILKVQYFAEDDTELTTSEIEAYDASVRGIHPYIRLSYNSTCSAEVTFNLTYLSKPQVSTTQILVCEETSYSLDEFKNTVISSPNSYTFTDELGNALPNSFSLTSLPLNVNFYITNNSTGCQSDLQTVTFYKGTDSVLDTYAGSTTKCDTYGDLFDGKTEFNLADYKALFTSDTTAEFTYFRNSSRTDEITDFENFVNTTAFSQIIYLKIALSNYCPVEAELTLNIDIPTKSSTLQDKYYICYGDTAIIDAGTENESYTWSDGQTSQNASFTEAGSYSVTLTNSLGCSYTHEFVISDENQPVIQQINQTNDKIEVIATGGITPYEYSFDGGVSWQNENYILNPTLETYTIYVRSFNGCLGAPKTIYFISVKNAITPNHDGINDTWTVENIGQMQNVVIQITDRYGKPVFYYDQGGRSGDVTTSPNPNTNTSSFDPVWDGTNMGRELPTASYWYFVKWYDPVTLKNEVRQGWILLKNRN